MEQSYEKSLDKVGELYEGVELVDHICDCSNPPYTCRDGVQPVTMQGTFFFFPFY